MDNSTTSAGLHIKASTPGHGFDKCGPVNTILSKHNSLLSQLLFKNVEVPQRVANAMALSFNQDAFLSAIQSFIIADNQALRVIEHPAF